MKIAIYGLTFDPIHQGHLILARGARELFGPEKVIFVPAAVSPFKDSPSASAAMRLSMLQAAIEGEVGFAVDDCELQRPPPSYTIDTIEEIRRRNGNEESYYLIAEDKLAALGKQHRFAEAINLLRL